MNDNRKLSYAVATILSGGCGAMANAGPADGATASDQLSEITVTAQRRSENVQNVPITIQTLTAETLTQLNVQTFDDAVKYLPNVTTGGQGPAQNNIFMRGLATIGGGIQASGTVGSFPNVAVYLDNVSGQVAGRNLDVYAVDLERIEVLEGPQGTLFGAGAEAGVVRYITNKPKLDVTEGNVNAGYAVTAHGDPSTNVDATINLPLIPEHMAIRGVIYNDSRGGYIRNLPATYTRAETDRGIIADLGGVVPPDSPSINNHALVGDAINPVTYKGIRAELLYKFNDDWDALLSQSYQSIDADGVSWEEQYDGQGKTLPPLSVELFNPSYDKDKFENTALTINGRINDLKVIYEGGFLNRHADQVQDYTNYSRGLYATYYQCTPAGYPFTNGNPTIVNGTPSSAKCYSPSSFWADHQKTTHQQHELRVSTPDDWRVRALGGLFWEKLVTYETTDWYYTSAPNFEQIAPPTNSTLVNSSTRPVGDSFFQDFQRGYTQKALFGSMDVEVIPRSLILTVGTRYYDIQSYEVGAHVTSFGCQNGGPFQAANPLPDPCVLPVAGGNNLNQGNLNSKYTGFRSRANLTWHVTDDALVYYTWSQGFRPGGFNQSQVQIQPSSPLYGLFQPQLKYGPDTLTNNEIGWKTQWFDRRFQFNGALYQENWNNVQLLIFDPGVTGNLPFEANGPNYRVRGVETSAIARVTHGLTLTAAASWNSSEVVKTLPLISSGPGAIYNPFGVLGSPLAQSPPFQGNIRARYEFDFSDYHAFAQAAAAHQAHSYASTDKLTSTLQGATVAFDDPGFTTYDASAGIAKDAWTAQVYGTNLTDVHAILFSTYSQVVKANTINVPRTIGVKFSYKF